MKLVALTFAACALTACASQPVGSPSQLQAERDSRIAEKRNPDVTRLHQIDNAKKTEALADSIKSGD